MFPNPTLLGVFCRDNWLALAIRGEYFNSACGQYFDRYPQNRNIHYSGKASEPLPPYVKSGRPDVMGVIQAAVKSGLEHEIYDVGVFVCGPNALVESSLAAADEVNADKTSAHVHVHAESFQM